jgi:hypothetical protein
MADIRCRKQQKQPGGAEGGHFKRASPAILPAGPAGLRTGSHCTLAGTDTGGQVRDCD